MTQRDFYTAIVNSDLNDELKAYATEAIAKLDARNAKRASTPSKTQKENAPLIEKIATLLTSEPKLASELAKEMGLSTQKVTPLVKAVEGVSVTDVKVKGKGTQKGYYIAEQPIKRTDFTSVLFLDKLFRTYNVRKKSCIYSLNVYNYIIKKGGN